MSPPIWLNDTSTDMCKHVYNLCYTLVSVDTEGFPSNLTPVNRPNMMPPNQVGMQVPRGPGMVGGMSSNPQMMPPHLMNSSSTCKFLIALILSICTCTCMCPSMCHVYIYDIHVRVAEFIHFSIIEF